MATNPMQKKARVQILIGLFIGLLIGAVVIVLLFLQLSKLQKEKQQIKEATKQVYVFKADVKSGDKIDSSKVELKTATKDVVPSDFIGVGDLTEATIAKIDIAKGSVLSKTILNESTEKTTSDLREQQYNMVVLPQYLEEGDYIDIRLTLPSGTDFIVTSKKKINQISEDTIWINMYEEESLAMSNAIVEAYKMTGSKLYATTYVDPGNQKNATPTYVPSADVIKLMNADPNIEGTAREALNARYTAGLREKRDQDIQGQLNSYQEQAKSNLETKLEQEITNSKENRKKYLDSLDAGTVE